MKQVIVDILDNKLTFFIELVNNLGFVKKVNTLEEPTKAQILSELKEAAKELSLVEKGKATSRPINALLDELCVSIRPTAHKQRV